jgi:hypothetical protein
MSNRTILVTGAGRGIGRAIAVRLAHSGWRVYGGVRTDVAAKELAAESDLITPVELDVTVPEHLVALDHALPERLDALANNAGVGVAGPLETLSRSDMHHQFDVNLIGPLALTRTVLPRLRRARGRVVFISSINGRVSFPFTLDLQHLQLRDRGRGRGRLPTGGAAALRRPSRSRCARGHRHRPWHEMDQQRSDLEAGLEPEHRALDAQHFAGERQLVSKIRRNAKPADQVAAAVEHQLNRRRMRPAP